MIMSTETLGELLILTPPDTEVMKTARQNILAHVTALKLDFLPVMKEKMRPLQDALISADKVYSQALATVTVQLNNVYLKSIDQKQQLIEADTRLSDKQKQQAISQLNGQRIRQVSNLTAVVRRSAQAIAGHSDDMAQINLTLENNRLLETLQQQIDSITQRSATLESAMALIAADRRLLDTTITTFEKYNLADVFKEMLPTPEELKLVNMTSPELELVNAGIARLGKLLDKVSSALKYLDLIEERDRLRSRYNALLDDSRTAAREAKAIKEKLDELTALAGVAQSKALWVQEAKKVYQSLYHFLDQITSPVDTSTLISQQVEQLQTYIKSFYDVKRIV
ncbi:MULTISPECIES: alpha-xenorhabdolysin family binary toxin subunit B [Pseudomonas]|uniref:Alpha-xenorhabdolysin family binary toxin subunit B n=1 Tax=Pseudomonas syringae Cit 7 TaxID=629264 RepID=A0A8T8M4H6_PSESX|nr:MULTISPECIES: alpha-xenorhabdolysin family binary toxin subunit B [Pseudomonas]MCK9748108.1 alpha-xenorhabdolysin family binary toxin subunit B [Pseudomonas syringae pv. syringae]KTB94098.1 toxin [Pseudomonas syringae ICMP 11293]KTC05946.1 toxin [Pseudomonas sp. ICMP 10191]MCH5654091.1 alpha-xenorhabdolysin family binary toxin subunit B [Pseudomonas syringae]MCK9779050.1 alpha-xenorhabdolysin family binary toxin subunit B [Pseudomonas syringae pv. syringae]